LLGWAEGARLGLILSEHANRPSLDASNEFIVFFPDLPRAAPRLDCCTGGSAGFSIFFDDEAQFEASADRLAEALDTDISWIRQHTEFGEAARRWPSVKGPPGLLLRSPVLEQAERWIASRPHRVVRSNVLRGLAGGSEELQTAQLVISRLHPLAQAFPTGAKSKYCARGLHAPHGSAIRAWPSGKIMTATP
jgi:hypothetical protein